MCLSEEKVQKIGHVAHFFPKISVAVIALSAPLSVGDTIVIKGPNTDFEQEVASMQIEHVNVSKAGAGQSVGLKVKERVRETDSVYKKL
jgi:selenocysteine-specific translation elongation factor